MKYHKYYSIMLFLTLSNIYIYILCIHNIIKHMAVITVAITMYCYSRLDYACCRIWTCSKWPRNAAKEMFPQNSRLAPFVKGLSNFTGRIQAMYLGQVTIIHQPEIKEKNHLGRIHPIPTISQAVMLWWGCHYSPRLSPWSPPELQSNLGFESVSLQVFLFILWISPISNLYIYMYMYTFKYIHTHTLFPTYIYLYQCLMVTSPCQRACRACWACWACCACWACW